MLHQRTLLWGSGISILLPKAMHISSLAWSLGIMVICSISSGQTQPKSTSVCIPTPWTAFQLQDALNQPQPRGSASQRASLDSGLR